ncbi:MAG: hypothetical protein MRZ79_21195 [Bacteroidia bacterium]|nr:hypothetical protein [Bacteroidia bacterium]
MANKDPLVEHTLQYALAIRGFGKQLPMSVANVEDLKELIRSSGLVGQIYLQATQATNKRDFQLGVRACYNQLDKTIYWLKLVDVQGEVALDQKRGQLIAATEEIMDLLKRLIQN